MQKLSFLLVTIIIFFSACEQPGYTKPIKYQEEDYVRAIIGEAENQGYHGMLAVACAIKNRPERLEGVFGRFSFRPDLAAPEIQRHAWQVYQEAKNPVNCRFIQGADMWHSGTPAPRSWRKIPMIYIGKIGDHYFYRRLTNGK